MAADDKIDVQITASPANFVAGVNTAQQALTNSAAQMQQSAGGMSASVRASMLSLQQNARSAMSGFGSSVTNAMSSVTSSVGAMKAALGAAGIGIVGIFGSSTKAALDYEKALLGLSRTSGMSIATSSELAFAASQVGMSTDDLTRNIGFLARSLAALEKNADSNTNAFNRFGIEVHNAN
ncbi:hypothetical protein, partial [Selenomonas sp. F0473]|uniref:hypothetical protein n=1 Tax=Selenomonas sp. F0473 TaxID=999423 RepID=UPI0025EE6738